MVDSEARRIGSRPAETGKKTVCRADSTAGGQEKGPAGPLRLPAVYPVVQPSKFHPRLVLRLIS